MAQEVDLTKEKVSGKEIKEQRKTNRFFGLSYNRYSPIGFYCY